VCSQNPASLLVISLLRTAVNKQAGQNSTNLGRGFSMAIQGREGKGEKPWAGVPTVEEAPEVKQALGKAHEYAKLAAEAVDPRKREYFLRMERKWLGIADGWRVIANVDKTQ
jgi:hypothetical protein